MNDEFKIAKIASELGWRDDFVGAFIAGWLAKDSYNDDELLYVIKITRTLYSERLFIKTDEEILQEIKKRKTKQL
jgi:fructose-1-phosphate kinase PfkB-like protein